MAADEPALVTFTTGSTGTPKGTNRTHAILLAQHHALARQVEDAEHARVWTNLPVVVLHDLGRGVETVLPPDARSARIRCPDPKRFHRLGRALGCHDPGAQPRTARTARARARDEAPLDAVERVYTGGGPVTPELLQSARGVLPNARITALYGSTEAEPIAHASAEQVLGPASAMRAHGGIYVGHEVEDVELRIVRPVGGPLELEPGTSLEDWSVAADAPGEVLVAGDHVNRDYWRNPDAVRENKVVDEHGTVWHRTGDIARRDADGGLWLLGRRGHGWNVGGRRLWALELETPVSDLTEVARAAICVRSSRDPSASSRTPPPCWPSSPPRGSIARRHATPRSARCASAGSTRRSRSARSRRSRSTSATRPRSTSRRCTPSSSPSPTPTTEAGRTKRGRTQQRLDARGRAGFPVNPAPTAPGQASSAGISTLATSMPSSGAASQLRPRSVPVRVTGVPVRSFETASSASRMPWLPVSRVVR